MINEPFRPTSSWTAYIVLLSCFIGLFVYLVVFTNDFHPFAVVVEPSQAIRLESMQDRYANITADFAFDAESFAGLPSYFPERLPKSFAGHHLRIAARGDSGFYDAVFTSDDPPKTNVATSSFGCAEIGGRCIGLRAWGVRGPFGNITASSPCGYPYLTEWQPRRLSKATIAYALPLGSGPFIADMYWVDRGWGFDVVSPEESTEATADDVAAASARQIAHMVSLVSLPPGPVCVQDANGILDGRTVKISLYERHVMFNIDAGFDAALPIVNEIRSNS